MHALSMGFFNQRFRAKLPVDAEILTAELARNAQGAREFALCDQADADVLVPPPDLFQKPGVGRGYGHRLIQIASLYNLCQAIAENVQALTRVFFDFQLQVFEVVEPVQKVFQRGNSRGGGPGAGAAACPG